MLVLVLSVTLLSVLFYTVYGHIIVQQTSYIATVYIPVIDHDIALKCHASGSAGIVLMCIT